MCAIAVSRTRESSISDLMDEIADAGTLVSLVHALKSKRVIVNTEPAMVSTVENSWEAVFWCKGFGDCTSGYAESSKKLLRKTLQRVEWCAK